MKRAKVSIYTKAVIMTVLFATLLITVTMFVFSGVMNRANDERFKVKADSLAKTTAQVIDTEKFIRLRDMVLEIYNKTDKKVGNDNWGSDEWNEYVALFAAVSETEDFKSLREDLRDIQNANGVDCIYLGVVDFESGYCLYVVDSAEDGEACPPGSYDYVFDIDPGLKDDPDIGFPAYITDTEEYGWLVTAGAAIHGADGKYVGYALTDISVEEIRSTQARITLNLLGIMTACVIVLTVLCILAVRRLFVIPTNKLTEAAREYTRNKSVFKTDVFSKLDIHTGDEIEDLAESMKYMEEEINEKIDNLVSANKELEESRDYANQMAILANTDALTGAGSMTLYDIRTDELDEKVREGTAPVFCIVMADLNKLKRINDLYGHLEGNNAIIGIYNMLADAFGKDGVYRIGGDEFAVLLFGSDVQKVGSTVFELNARIDAMIDEAKKSGEEIVTAAVGYAVYDPETDKRLADVYTRADNAMYDRKRAMESE